MARTAKAPITNRTQRRKNAALLVPRIAPYYQTLGRGLLLGYQARPAPQPGRWVVRKFINGDRIQHVVGTADDFQSPDGHEVLSFEQASKAAHQWVANLPDDAAGRRARGLTVADAIEEYLTHREQQKGAESAKRARQSLTKWVLGDKLAKRAVAELTLADLMTWRETLLASDPDDPDIKRKSRDTANRIVHDLKAALNHAFQSHGETVLPSDGAWRRLKPFKHVAEPRAAWFDEYQLTRLLDAAARLSPQFGNLCTVAALTGARLGELRNAKVGDLDRSEGTLSVRGKTGARQIILTAKVQALLSRIAGKRPDEAYLLSADNGDAWPVSAQHRRIKEALRLANDGARDRENLPEDASFYALRHTYATIAIESGVAPGLIATNMGTSETMLRKTYAKVFAHGRRHHFEKAEPKLRLVR